MGPALRLFRSDGTNRGVLNVVVWAETRRSALEYELLNRTSASTHAGCSGSSVGLIARDKTPKRISIHFVGMGKPLPPGEE